MALLRRLWTVGVKATNQATNKSLGLHLPRRWPASAATAYPTAVCRLPAREPGDPIPRGGGDLRRGGGTPSSLCPGGGVSPPADHDWRLGRPTNRGRYIGIRIPHNNKQINNKRNWLKKKRCRSGTRELGAGKAIGVRAFLFLIVVAGSCPVSFSPSSRILGRTGTSARSVAVVPFPPAPPGP